MRLAPGKPWKVFLDGKILPADGAKLGVFDRGFLFGDGCYETFRTYGTVPFRIREHLVRLRGSTYRLGFRGVPSSAALARGVARLVSANRLRDARVRIVVSRGEGWPELRDLRTPRPTVLAYSFPCEVPPAAAYLDGVRVIMARTLRNDAGAVDHRIKSTSQLNSLLARREADRAGAYDGVLCNPRGFVAEGVASNVFFVRRGALFTPALSAGLLPGITRTLVLALARRMRIPVREGLFRPAEFLRADEAFLTSSTVEIVPISRAGARRFPRVRSVTRALQDAYAETVSRETGGVSPWFNARG